MGTVNIKEWLNDDSLYGAYDTLNLKPVKTGYGTPYFEEAYPDTTDIKVVEQWLITYSNKNIVILVDKQKMYWLLEYIPTRTELYLDQCYKDMMVFDFEQRRMFLPGSIDDYCLDYMKGEPY